VRRDKITEDLDLTILQDKSELLKAKDAFKEIEGIYENILENIYDAILVSNKKLKELLNFDTEAEIIDIFSFCPEFQYDGKHSTEKFKEIHKERFDNSNEKLKWKFITKSGKAIHTEISLIRNFDDEKFNTIVLITDITESYNIKTDNITKESLLKHIYENNFTGIVVDLIDKMNDKVHKSYNTKILEILEIENTKVDRNNFKKYFTEKQDNGVDSVLQYNLYEEELKEKGALEYEFKLKTEKGKIKYVLVQSVKQSIDARFALCISNLKDITKEKIDARTIKVQIEKLENQNKQLTGYLKSNQNLESFAYKAAHDLKGPLRNVSGFAQLLQRKSKSNLDAESNEFVEFIVKSSKNMIKLVDDLLDYARLGSNTQEYSKVDINSILNLIEYELGDTLKTDKIIIEKINIDEAVFGNQVLIKRLFKELILNAIYLGRNEQKIVIEISCKESANKLMFTVTSNGEGYHPNNLQTVFSPLNNSNENKMSLAIVSRIIQQHDCNIYIESEENKYASFYFNLPNRPVMKKREEAVMSLN